MGTFGTFVASSGTGVIVAKGMANLASARMCTATSFGGAPAASL